MKYTDNMITDRPMWDESHRVALISDSLALSRHQPKLQDYGHRLDAGNISHGNRGQLVSTACPASHLNVECTYL